MWEIYIFNSKIYTVQAQNTQLSIQGREDTQDKLYLSEGYSYVIISKKENNTLIVEKSRHYVNNHLGNRSFELNIS